MNQSNEIIISSKNVISKHNESKKKKKYYLYSSSYVNRLRNVTKQIDRQIDRQLDRQIDRHIDRQEDKQVERQIDRHLDRQIDKKVDRQRVSDIDADIDRYIDRLDENSGFCINYQILPDMNLFKVDAITNDKDNEDNKYINPFEDDNNQSIISRSNEDESLTVFSPLQLFNISKQVNNTLDRQIVSHLDSQLNSQIDNQIVRLTNKANSEKVVRLVDENNKYIHSVNQLMNYRKNLQHQYIQLSTNFSIYIPNHLSNQLDSLIELDDIIDELSNQSLIIIPVTVNKDKHLDTVVDKRIDSDFDLVKEIDDYCKSYKSIDSKLNSHLESQLENKSDSQFDSKIDSKSDSKIEGEIVLTTNPSTHSSNNSRRPSLRIETNENKRSDGPIHPLINLLSDMTKKKNELKQVVKPIDNHFKDDDKDNEVEILEKMKLYGYVDRLGVKFGLTRDNRSIAFIAFDQIEEILDKKIDSKLNNQTDSILDIQEENKIDRKASNKESNDKCLLGRGKFAEVYLAQLTHQHENYLPIALKFFSFRSNNISNYTSTYQSIELTIYPPRIILIETIREILALTSLSHPNIIDIIGLTTQPLAILMEYMNCGNLSTWLDSLEYSNNDKTLDSQRNSKLDNKLDRKIDSTIDSKIDSKIGGLVNESHDRDLIKEGLLVDIATGIQHMHSQRFVHRDIKSHNVLIHYNSSTNSYLAKLSDFGTALRVPIKDKRKDRNMIKPVDSYQDFSNQDSRIDSKTDSNVDSKVSKLVAGFIDEDEIYNEKEFYHIVGTSGYIAPEILSGGRYNFSADIFALAIVAWEIFSANMRRSGNPIVGLDEDRARDMLFNGVRPELTSSHPQHLQSIIKESWTTDPSTRPVATAIVNALNFLSPKYLSNHTILSTPLSRRDSIRMRLRHIGNNEIDGQIKLKDRLESNKNYNKSIISFSKTDSKIDSKTDSLKDIAIDRQTIVKPTQLFNRYANPRIYSIVPTSKAFVNPYIESFNNIGSNKNIENKLQRHVSIYPPDEDFNRYSNELSRLKDPNNTSTITVARQIYHPDNRDYVVPTPRPTKRRVFTAQTRQIRERNIKTR